MTAVAHIQMQPMLICVNGPLVYYNAQHHTGSVLISNLILTDTFVMCNFFLTETDLSVA